MQHNCTRNNENIVKNTSKTLYVRNFISICFCNVIFFVWSLCPHTCLEIINFGLIYYILAKKYIENIHFCKLEPNSLSHET